ncbi:transposase [Thermodesulfobacteriota bacterium]
MKKKIKGKYTKKFMSRAVKLVVEDGLSIRSAAKKLSMPKTTLSRWIKTLDEGEVIEDSPRQPESASESTEIDKLRQEISAIKDERDKLKDSITEISARAEQVSITQQTENMQLVGSYDETILDLAREQWKVGDWDSLVKMDAGSLEFHPERAKLALLVAAGYQQKDDLVATRSWLRLAQEWGCDKKLISRVLIAGVYSTLGTAAVFAQKQESAYRYFQSAVALGVPGSEARNLARARMEPALAQLDFSDVSALTHSSSDVQVNRFQKSNVIDRSIVRTIHHFACTGGTLFAKCLAALSNVVVLNEIDPFSDLGLDSSDKPAFKPRDTISLMRQSGGQFDDDVIRDVFRNDIKVIVDSLSIQNKHLVLRDHPHSAYMVGPEMRHSNSLRDTLAPSFDLKSIVTVRNPIDSYLSLRELGWIHYQPGGFDEYCRRYLAFMDDNQDIPVVRYEDFVQDSLGIMQSICSHLALEYHPDFVNKFGNYKFSGDSGRSGNVISPRERRPFDDDFLREVNGSTFYKDLASILGYDSILVRQNVGTSS